MDLYNDLDITTNVTDTIQVEDDKLKQQITELEKLLEQEKSKNVQLEALLRDKTKDLKVTAKQRDTLLLNISILYKTAIKELERKNKEIERLREATTQ